MKEKYVLYNNGEKESLKSYGISSDIIILSYQDVNENLSGFSIYDGNDNLIMDCSDFIYRWDVLEDSNNKIYYTNSPDNVQTMKFNTDDQEEEVEPLNNRELTEAVADLIYELSVTQLGLQ